MENEIKTLLEDVKSGKISVDEALLKLKSRPFEDIDFAKIDLHRNIRQGTSEVIFGQGKTASQIISIIETMIKNNQSRILITRLSPEKAEEVQKAFELKYFPEAKIGIIGEIEKPKSEGKILVATGGTSDIPVAEEAAITAEFLGICFRIT